MNRTPLTPGGVVVDLFCGAGGLTHGFKQEGFKVAAGIDIDETCRYPYERNNGAPFVRKDIASVDAAYLRSLFSEAEPSILVGCAPCQPFSTYNQKNDDPKWELVGHFARLISEVRPDYVSMENVPRLVDFKGGEIFLNFVELLHAAGYHVSHKVVFAPDYGVPQRRLRLVLLASKASPIHLIEPIRTPETYITVKEAIGHLPPIVAGQAATDDAMHVTSKLNEVNLRRIRSSKPGGTWRDWADDLVADCHKVPSGKGYGSVYGRMRWEEPSPTITTQFFGFGNGRFGHPSQDRALSLREGAILQSFPPDYAFSKPGDRIQFKQLGKMIGNAVPVLLGRAIARSIALHLGGQNGNARENLTVPNDAQPQCA